MKDYPRLNFITTENAIGELESICTRRGITKSAALNEALVNYITDEFLKRDGGMVLRIENPQEKAEATKMLSMSVFTLLCEMRRLDLDEKLYTGGAFKQIEKFLYNRLVAENAEDGIFRF